MEISTPAISIPDRPQRAIWVTSARRRRDAGDNLDEAIASAQGVLEFALSEFLLLPEAKPARRLVLRYPPWHLRDQIERTVARI
jgi:hypothetical protein